MAMTPEHDVSGIAANARVESASEAGTHDVALGAALRSLVQEAGSLAYEHLLLAALEAQRAGRNLIRMVIAGIFTAVLAITAWLALVAAIASWWVDHGASWPQAFIAMAVLNLVIAGAVVFWIRQLAAAMMFSATLRALKKSSPGKPKPDRTEPPVRTQTRPEAAR